MDNYEENVFQLFSQAIKDGDSVQLDQIFNYFETINSKMRANFSNTKIIPMDFITRPLNEQGETCLEVATNNGHWSILKILFIQIKFHVYEQWKLPTRNLPSSFVFQTKDKEFIRDICSRIPITDFIGNLIAINDDDFIWLEFILDGFMQSSSISKSDKMIALQLMGAAYIFWWPRNPRFQTSRHLSDLCISKGIQCWKYSLILRREEENAPEIPYVLPERLRHVFSRGNANNEMTLEELGEAERQLIRYQSNINWNRAEIKPLQIQAIVICHKIFSRSNRHTLMYLIYHEELVMNHHSFSNRCGASWRTVNLVLFCIETFCHDISNVLSSSKHLRVFIRSLELVDTNRFTSYDLLTIAKCTLKILANLHPQSFGSQPVGCRDSEIWDIYNRMLMFFPKLNVRHVEELKHFFSDYVGDFKSNCGFTSFLRVIIEPIDYLVHNSIDEVQLIFQFFLDAGVDPNEIDTNGQAPIHILAQHIEIKGVPIMLKSLLNAGAHIDQGTPDGETLGSILRPQQFWFIGLSSFYPFESLANDPLNVVLPLSCYCAQSIRRNGIPFEDQLPHKLEEFVKVH